MLEISNFEVGDVYRYTVANSEFGRVMVWERVVSVEPPDSLESEVIKIISLVSGNIIVPETKKWLRIEIRTDVEDVQKVSPLEALSLEVF